MIKHVICVKLKDGSQEHKEKVRELFLSMKGKVPSVKGISVGVDFLCSPRSYDVILLVDLESREALDEYQQDEYHVNVVKKYIHEAAEKTISVDYDLQ